MVAYHTRLSYNDCNNSKQSDRIPTILHSNNKHIVDKQIGSPVIILNNCILQLYKSPLLQRRLIQRRLNECDINHRNNNTNSNDDNIIGYSNDKVIVIIDEQISDELPQLCTRPCIT